MVERIVAASPSGWNAPNTRYRLGPVARDEVWPIQVLSASSLPTVDQVDALLECGGRGAALILQRVLPSTPDLERLRQRYDRLLLDIDDAIYAVPPDISKVGLANVPKQAARLIARGSPNASARKRPLERTLRFVDVCIVGNAVLGRFARRFTSRVMEIPTTVEPVDAPPPARPQPPVLVWVGVPDNLQYLEFIRRPLSLLRSEFDFVIRVVSSRTWQDPPLEVEFVPWSQEAAREALLSSTVGLAPLVDHPWTRGKCAFRSIQYGGHALPTVASSVGITDRVVLSGRTGFLAQTREEWLDSLRTLLANPELTNQMGLAALNHIRAFYSDAVAAKAWRELLASL